MADMHVVHTQVDRASASEVETLARFGVATIHEAQGRTGLLTPAIRPIQSGVRIAGTAVTVSLPPGDNWMVHAAIEQCRSGDVVIVAPTSASEVAYVGELLATSMAARGARGAVIDAGVRDVSELREIGFPVWSRLVSAQGAVKESLGSVNVPVICAGALVLPGDVVVADDDGVCVIPRRRATEVATACAEREAREGVTRRLLQSGELGLDIYAMRGKLAALGLEYRERPADC